MPKNPDGRVLVHIGCGKVRALGFVNVDAVPLSHVHVPTDDVTNLPCFSDGSVDMVYTCHVLEHFKAEEFKQVLEEIYRILKPGGIFRMSVPDFDRLIDVYNASGKEIGSISRQLMGGQDDRYNVHYGVFTRRSLSSILEATGFCDVRDWDPVNCRDHDFKDKADRRLKVNGVEYPVSLNIEATKPSV